MSDNKAGAKFIVAPKGGGFTAGGDLAGTSTSQTVIGIQGRPVSSAAPSSGQVLEWNGSLWVPTTPSAGGVTSVTAGDASVTASPTTGAVVVEAGTLDQIANLHPPAADWSNNSKKITSLANGSAAQDAAAFGQIPTTLPSPLTVIAQQTTNYTANPWEYVPCNFGGGSFTLTLPTAPADKTQVGFIIQSAGFNILTIAAGAGDAFATGTSTVYRNNGQSAVFQYTASTKVWTALPGNTPLPIPGDASIQITQHNWNPSFETGSLDQVANLHPPIAPWTNNLQQINNLADGTLSTDAAAVGQLPPGATTVTGPDAFGASAVVGTGTLYARNDHDHGLPTLASSAWDGWLADTNTWTYSSVDGHTSVLTVNADLTGRVGLGDRIKLTNNSLTQYFIVTAISVSTGTTTITMYGGAVPVVLNASYTNGGGAVTSITVMALQYAVPGGATLVFANGDTATVAAGGAAAGATSITIGSKTPATANGGWLQGASAQASNYVLANSAITAPFYSHMKSPFGFNADPQMWTELLWDVTNASQATPTSDVFYQPNALTLVVPIGSWKLEWSAQAYATAAATTTVAVLRVSPSTSSSAWSDPDLIAYTYNAATAGAGHSLQVTIGKEKHLVVAAKRTYVMTLIPSWVTAAPSAVGLYGPWSATAGAGSTTKLEAACAYL